MSRGAAGSFKSSGKSAHAKRYRKPYTENVYDYADDHQLQGKRTLGGSGEWHHDAVHEEINGHAIYSAENDCLIHQDANRAARHKVDSGGPKCADEVTEKAEQPRCAYTLE